MSVLLPWQIPVGFGFVLNPFDHVGELPLTVVPGVVLDKAAAEERESIELLLKELGGLARWGQLFDFEPIRKELRASPNWDRKLHRRETYWILRFENPDADAIERICETSQLCDTEFELGAVIPRQGVFIPRVIIPSSFFYYTEVQWECNAQVIDESDVKIVAALHSRIGELKAESLDPKSSRVFRLLEKFHRLSAGKRYGEWPFVGHFALLEGLVTHEPQAHAGDSISHQISTKMPLLMRKFSRPLSLADYTDEDDPHRVWKLLYNVRSRIAHGDEAFVQGKHTPLRTLAAALKFVRESLKRVFIIALYEPEFISDLKAC